MNNKQNPRIIQSPKLQLAGFNQPMSLYSDQTAQLWTRFMTLFVQETYRLGPNKYNVQLYPNDYFSNFDPSKEFIKWAAAEHRGDIPPTLEELEVPEGLYAVFLHTSFRSDGTRLSKRQRDCRGGALGAYHQNKQLTLNF
jgi:AraC family transcriptional regulator